MPKLLAKAAIIGAMGLVTATTAGAADSGSYDWVLHSNLSSTTQLSAPASASHMTTQSLVMGKSGGCYGQTDRPHDSHHVSGTINVVARTVCPTIVSVHVSLLKEHWYGLEFLHSNQDVNRVDKAQANAAGDCKKGENYTFYGVADHEGKGAGTASTMNTKNITCDPYIKN